MDKNTNDTSNQNHDAKSSEKNAQDVNKQPANSNMPNPTKNHQVGEEEVKENKDREVKATNVGSKTDAHTNMKADETTGAKTDYAKTNASHAKNEVMDANDEESTVTDHSAHKNHENEKRELNSGTKMDTNKVEK